MTSVITADLIIRRADAVLTCGGPAPRRGAAQNEVSALTDASVAALGERIVFVGPASRCDAEVRLTPDARIIDGKGCTVVPGFVDAHTHAVYAGDRQSELLRRLAGESYSAIAAAGGGILATVRATRSTDEAGIVAQSRRRLDEMLAGGTTTAEVKSGYGLDLPNELKLLRAIRQLDESHPIDLVPTFLGAHEVPLEHRDRRDAFIENIVHEMIPAVAGARLAEWCDVFCEQGVFTPDESIRILRAGQQAGLKARIHADEFGANGGAQAAAMVGARSADHLLFADAEGIAALASGGVVATLLPTAAFYLKIGRFAPGRALIQAGVPVSLGTDVNPGGGLSASMPFAMTLACFGMNLTLEEALIAATLNAAYSVDRDETVGSLETGKLMDAVMIRGGLSNLLKVGADTVGLVIKRGQVVASRR